MAQFTYKQFSHAEHLPYLMLSVREGGGAAPFCNCRFTRQDPTAILHQRSGAYVTSASSLQVEAAWVRGLSLETMPFWPGASRETNSSPRRATFRLKNARGSLCKHSAQHKATSAITSAEEQKPVQNWRRPPTSNALMLNTGHTSRSL